MNVRPLMMLLIPLLLAPLLIAYQSNAQAATGMPAPAATSSPPRHALANHHPFAGADHAYHGLSSPGG